MGVVTAGVGGAFAGEGEWLRGKGAWLEEKGVVKGKWGGAEGKGGVAKGKRGRGQSEPFCSSFFPQLGWGPSTFTRRPLEGRGADPPSASCSASLISFSIS